MPIDFTPDEESKIDFTPESPGVNFTPEISPAPQKTQGLISRMGADYNQRQQNMADYQTQYAQGKIGALPAEIGKIGQAGALAFVDPITGLMNAGAEDLYNGASPERQQQLQNIGTAAKKGINAFANSSANLGLPQISSGAINAAEQYYNQSPNLKAVAEGVGNLSQVIPMAGTEGSLIGKMMKAPIKASYEDVAPDILKSEFPKANSEQAFEHAKNLYAQSAAKGMMFNNDQISNIKSSLKSLEPNPDTLAGKSWEKSLAAKHVNDINDVLDKGTLSFNDILDRRSDINSDIKAAFRAGHDKDAARLLKVKDALTNAMLTNDAPEWQMANHEFSKAASMEPLEDLAIKASTKLQPANQLDTYINNMLLNDNKIAGLRPNEVEALKMVTQNAPSDAIKKQLASGFSKYAAMAVASKLGIVGKVGGYILGGIGSALAKNSAFTDKLKKLDMVYEAINSRELNMPKSTSIGSRALVPAGPLVNHMTDEQIAHAQAVMNRTGNPVTTPYSGAPVSPTMQKFLPSPQTAGRLPAEGSTEAEIAHARARLAATPQVSNPYSGAPIAPQTNPAGSLTNPVGQEGYAMSIDDLYGNNPNVPDIEAYGPTKKKKAGGAIKGKIGFNLKKTKK